MDRLTELLSFGICTMAYSSTLYSSLNEFLLITDLSCFVLQVIYGLQSVLVIMISLLFETFASIPGTVKIHSFLVSLSCK